MYAVPVSYGSSRGLLHSPLQRACVWYIATARVAPRGTLPDNDLVLLLFWSILFTWEPGLLLPVFPSDTSLDGSCFRLVIPQIPFLLTTSQGPGRCFLRNQHNKRCMYQRLGIKVSGCEGLCSGSSWGNDLGVKMARSSVGLYWQVLKRWRPELRIQKDNSVPSIHVRVALTRISLLFL